jgi:hypothetical protein
MGLVTVTERRDSAGIHFPPPLAYIAALGAEYRRFVRRWL